MARTGGNRSDIPWQGCGFQRGMTRSPVPLFDSLLGGGPVVSRNCSNSLWFFAKRFLIQDAVVCHNLDAADSKPGWVSIRTGPRGTMGQ